jgi:hypothetical protein
MEPALLKFGPARARRMSESAAWETLDSLGYVKDPTMPVFRSVARNGRRETLKTYYYLPGTPERAILTVTFAM